MRFYFKKFLICILIVLTTIFGNITIVNATELATNQVTATEFVEDQIDKPNTNEVDIPNVTEPDEVVEEKIDVTDIDISGYESVIEVGETLALSATIIPSDASEQNVSYSSSNSAIATVSQTGEVKGISAGYVQIYASAGMVVKQMDINVKVSAKGINTNKNYIVLKPGQTQQITASVYPLNTTDSNITYSSSKTSVATVSNTGLVKAVDCGSATIILKNADAMACVTVIVSNNSLETVNNTTVEKIVKEEESISNTLSANEYSIISSEILKQLYDTQKTLCIVGDGYNIYIDGKNIKNINNPIKTDIELIESEEELSFNLNEGNNLCGDITVEITDAEKYKYLYLFNESENKYKLIECKDITQLTLTSSGKYLLTTSNLTYSNIPWVIIVVVSCIFIILLVIYIIIKRRYWFW
ncbi:MAG: Ig-like domain-containing protein [Acutalibacteraceae bacterium]|nr:Ig-like domain-containing protein [Acutalibacteraceae bacterium]